MAKQGKGSAFERQICKDLSLWWTEGDRDDVFYRTSNSGGRAATRAKKGRSTINQHGDICCTDLDGQPLLDLLTFEVKRGYSSDTLGDLLDFPPTAALQRWEQWIIQAQRSKREAGSLGWAIVSKRDRRKALITIEERVSSLLIDPAIGCLFFQDLRNEEGEWDYVRMQAMDLEWFLAQVPPAHVRQIVRETR